MPNTLTIAATKANTAKAIEYSVDGGTTWQDANVFTAVPAGTLAIGQVKARLKTSSPAVAATWNAAVVVSGPVGTRLAAPASGAATPTSATTMSVAASSVANATGYQLYRSTSSTGTYVPVGGTLSTPSYSDTGLTAGTTYYYEWQAVGNGTTYLDSAPGAVFSGTTSATPTMPSYLPADANWRDGNFKLGLGLGSMRNTFAQAASAGTTPATLLRFSLISNAYLVGLATDYYGLFVNGAFQRVNFTSDGTVKTVDVTIPAGSTIGVISHDLARYGAGSQVVAGAALVDLQANGAITWATAPAPAHRFLVIGDSIVGGNVGTEPVLDGWVPRTRAAWAGSDTRLTVDSFSGGSLVDVYGAGVSSADKAILRAHLISQADGTVDNTLVIAYGTNDYGRGTATAAAFGAAYANLLDDLRTAAPALRLVCITPSPITNGNDAALETYRAQIRTVVNARGFVFKLLENLVDAANIDPIDHIHPTTAGQAQYAARFQAQFINNASILANYAFADVNYDGATGVVSGWRDSAVNASNVVNGSGFTDPTRTSTHVAFAGVRPMAVVAIPGLAATQNTGLTVFQVVSLPASNAPTLVSLGLQTTDGQRLAVGLLNTPSGDRYGLSTYTGAVSGTVNPATKLATSVLVSMNIHPSTPNAFQLYLNGILQDDASTVTSGNSGNPVNDDHAIRTLNGNLEIGGPNGSGIVWQGTQDHVRVCTLLADAARQAMEAELRALYGL